MSKKYEKLSREQLLEKIKKLEKQRYGLVWDEKLEDVAEQCDKELPVLKELEEKRITLANDLPYNIIIEGDNYHTLYTLNFTHKRKIDLIYIDPPYNTGAKNWKYNNHFVDANDPYRHSKWLSFMNKRLRLAKGLLKADGVLICAIDKNEQAPLALLLEKIFVGYEIHCITIIHNPRGVQGKNFSYTHEYAFFVFPSGKKIISDRLIEESEIYWSNLRNWGSESLRSDAKNCFYPIKINPETCQIIEFGDVCPNDFHPTSRNVKEEDCLLIYPIDGNGIERKWRYARQSINDIIDLLRARKKKGIWDIEIGKDFGINKTVWDNPKYDANEYGTKIIKELVPDCDFDFPKSVYTVYDCIYTVIKERKNAIVLDYFAGSGTTGHAVLKLNQLDNGKRQFILCTNNEVGEKKEAEFKKINQISEQELLLLKKENNTKWLDWSEKFGICSSVCLPRIKALMTGNDYSQPFIANLKYYKTEFTPIILTDNDKRILVNRSTELLCLAENTFDHVKSSAENFGFSIFKNSRQYTAIIFDEDSIGECKKVLMSLAPVVKTTVYVFSYDHEYNVEDFLDLLIPCEIKPIPEAILNVYRRNSNISKK